jgi:hypothetical protein
VRWQQLQQHNRIDNPYRLPPGQLLRFPISWLRTEPAPARVLSVRGKVELSGADGSASRAIQAGEQLHIGDTVQTEGESSVTLEFADASRLQLREYSRLRLDQLSRYGHTGMVDTRLRLQQGRASNRVTPARGPASRYIIDAPTATSSVRGTVFRVSAGDTGCRATEVLQGKVQVGNTHGQRMVQPGQATRSAAQTPPGRSPPCCRHRSCATMNCAWRRCRRCWPGLRSPAPRTTAWKWCRQPRRRSCCSPPPPPIPAWPSATCRPASCASCCARSMRRVWKASTPAPTSNSATSLRRR